MLKRAGGAIVLGLIVVVGVQQAWLGRRQCSFGDGAECVPANLAGTSRVQGAEQVSSQAVWGPHFEDPARAVQRLESNGFRPRSDVKPWPVQVPIAWDADPFKDRNWRFQLHAMRMVDPYLRAYQESGNSRYLESALAYFMDWYRYHVEEGRHSDFAWYDMAVGLRAMKLGYLFQEVRRVEAVGDAAAEEALLKLAWRHVAELRDPVKLSAGNHGYFQLHGLRVLCVALPVLANCEGAGEYVTTHLGEMLARDFSEEGVFLEHSPQYHRFAMNIVADLKRSGLYPELGALNAVDGGMRESLPWFVLPGGRLLPVGDTSGSAQPAVSIEADRCLPNGQCYAHRVFDDAGYAVVRSPTGQSPQASSYLAFVGAYHSRYHKHADGLSLYWLEGEQPILVDAGKYSYNKNANRRYVISRRAHNTIWFVGDEGNDLRDDILIDEPYGSADLAVRDTRAGFQLSGALELTTLGVAHLRQVLYRPGEWLAVIDNVDGAVAQQNTLARGWLFDPAFDRRSGEGLEVLAAESEGSYRVFVAHDDPAGCTTDWHYGERSPRIQGWVSESYNDLTAAYQMVRRCPARSGRYVTVFGLSEAAARAGLDAAAEVTGDHESVAGRGGG